MVHIDTWTGQSSSGLDTHKVTLPHSAAKSWVVRHLLKVKCLPTLFLGDNILLIVWLFEVGCWAATLYQLADGCAALKLGMDGILDEISRVFTYHRPHIGCHFLSWALPLPYWEMAQTLGPPWCRSKTLQWHLWFCRRSCLFTMEVFEGKPTAKLHTNIDGGM